MRSAQKIAVYPLIWVLIGVSMVAVGLILHNELGWLLLFLGLLITPATLYVWLVIAMRRRRTHRSSPKQSPEPAPAAPAPEASFSHRVDGNSGIPTPQPEENGNTLLPALRLRINEEPLTVQHLLSTLTAFLSLYVKMHLLQQERFADFVCYTEQKDPRFEQEMNLPIAELRYNTPLTLTIALEKIPKAIAEAVKILVDTITQCGLRIQLKRIEVTEAHLKIADHLFEIMKKAAAMVDTLYPGLDEEKRKIAIQGFMDDIIKLVQNGTLEAWYLPAPAATPPTPVVKTVTVPSSLVDDMKREQARVKIA